jgi:SAM-dependent methyltransferase
MADWGSGYITDTAYVHDFCRVQTPPMLALAALAGGVAAPGGAGEPIAYCDLGCGQGYTANLVAAANPAAHVLGIDFNPSHIANARALAAASGLSNVEFREAGFDEVHDDPALPEFDVMCMHGVYGWVNADNRRALVSLIRKKLKPSGLLYISYDCMPGWAGIAPLRRILAQHFSPKPGLPSAAAIAQALAYSDALRKADSRFHRMFPFVEAQMERLKKAPRAYLAHELLPRDWEAFSFGDVAAELADAKLAYLGSAHLTDCVDRVNFTEEQQRFLGTINDPVLAEATRDMILARQFRRDVFVKGLVPLGETPARARWLNTRFALTTPGSVLDMTFDTALGKLQLRPDVYAPLIAILGEGPLTLHDLIERLPKPAPSWISLTDAVKVLVGRGDVQPCLPQEGDAKRALATRGFNTAVLARATQTMELGYLASPVTGGGVRVDRLTQMYLLARREGVADPKLALAKLAEGGALSGADGQVLSADDARVAVEKEAARIESDVLALLQRLGISG